MKNIYYHGKAFGESGRVLVESGNNNLFVPGIINICLSLEIFLKSINSQMSVIEDESELNGVKLYQGREGTMEIHPGGKGHALSKLYDDLPKDIRDEITRLSSNEGYTGDISGGLKQYDNVFTGWRYIYERRDLKSLGSHPLFCIVNAVNRYCEENLDQIICCEANEIAP